MKMLNIASSYNQNCTEMEKSFRISYKQNANSILLSQNVFSYKLSNGKQFLNEKYIQKAMQGLEKYISFEDGVILLIDDNKKYPAKDVLRDMAVSCRKRTIPKSYKRNPMMALLEFAARISEITKLSESNIQKLKEDIL